MSLKRTSAPILLLLAISIAACEVRREVPEAAVTEEIAAAPTVDTQAAEQEIRRLSSNYLRDYRAKNTDAIGNLFAENAISIYSGEGLRKGREAIRQDLERGFAERPANHEINWEPTEIRVSSAGDMAHELGTWQDTRNGQRSQGHYLTVWERIDGQWKIVRDISVPETASTGGQTAPQ